MSNETFVADTSGGETFTGTGTGNTLELSASTSLLTIDVPAGTLTGLSGSDTTDTFSDIQTFDGNPGSGGTTFFAGSIGGYTFVGEGAGGNTLNLSDATSGVEIFLTPNTQGQEVANAGTGDDFFTGITTIIGSAAGGNTFFGGPGNYTVEGEGSNNTLDYGASSSGVSFSVSDGSGTATPESGGGTASFSGIQIFEGSTAGDNIFTVGAGNQTLEGGGSNNEITFAADAAGITIDAATGTATTANGTDTFSDIQTFIGSSAGSNTFIVGSGSYTFESGGSGNTIVYTPQSNDVLAIGYSPASELLDFQGFGNSLNAQDVQNDATISNGNTYIKIPDAGTIELLGYTGGISPSDIEFTACYCRGTRIATDNREVAVEDLSIGDYVMTKSGTARPITWIGRRSYGGRFVMGRKDILPICIKAGALDDNVPKRDLWISPNHAMYLEGVLIEAKDLVNGVSIVQAERVAQVEYFHIELETQEVIIAEGALSESFIDDDSRFMFHNAHEYRVLYPAATQTVARYCAPRLDEGYELEAVRQRLAARAGLHMTKDELQVGRLRGKIDRISPRRIEGWAQNMDDPEAPVCLNIYASGQLIGQVLANSYRPDLERAGRGSGNHSFTFMPPDELVFTPDAIEVRRSLDGAALAYGASQQVRAA
jgi:Hint domain